MTAARRTSPPAERARRVLPGCAGLALAAALCATAALAAPAAPPAPPSGTGAHGAATAAPRWTVDTAHSALEYEFTQAGARNKGRFQRFPVSFRFTPGAPESGRLDVTVEMPSLDTGDKERDDTLRGTDMFDTAHFPQARFTAQHIVRSPGGFDAIGTLTLRGVAHEVHVPFSFRTASEGGRQVGYMSGRTSIHRLDFGVGQGEWRSTEWVGNEVWISYSLRLLAAQ